MMAGRTREVLPAGMGSVEFEERYCASIIIIIIIIIINIIIIIIKLFNLKFL
jgi:hypothetical protein